MAKENSKVVSLFLYESTLRDEYCVAWTTEDHPLFDAAVLTHEEAIQWVADQLDWFTSDVEKFTKFWFICVSDTAVDIFGQIKKLCRTTNFDKIKIRFDANGFLWFNASDAYPDYE